MRNVLLVGFLISVITAAGLAIWFDKYYLQDLKDKQVIGSESIEARPLAANDSATAAAAHPISLAALMQKDFNGYDFKVGQVLDSNSSYTRYYITYMSGNLKISGIMNVPAGDGPWPLLILNHGYIDPAVYTNGRGLKREQDYLVRQGFVVVHPDYRNHAQSDDDPDYETNFRLGYTEDVINAIYALQKASLPYIDLNNIGLLGHSMGGGVTQNVLVVKPDLVKAAVLYAPVSGDYQDNYERYTKRRPEVLQAFQQKYPDTKLDTSFWQSISAATYFERLTAPVAIFIGTADDSVEPAWSYAIRDRLTELGKNVMLYEYQGEAHEFSFAWNDFMQQSASFFKQHLTQDN